MIEYIRGEVVELTPAYVIVDNGGMGYMLNISLSTYTGLENAQGRVKLFVHEVIREDAWVLYGFSTDREREMFRLLIGVSGVGANTARMILSSVPTAELEAVIVSGDYGKLKNVKGIGTKTAQRIIVDLKDKIKAADETLLQQPVTDNSVHDEALAAMVMLGFPRPQAQKVLRKIFEANPTIKVEAAIKQALSMM